MSARPLRALVGALLVMDLRNQSYGKAIGAKPNELLPPVYWVLGQFLTTSMLLSLMLFARVEAWFFAFASLSSTAVLLFSALVVEFHEVVLDPADAEVLGHRPLSRRTYASARLLNLLAYVALMTFANAIFPLVLGSALRDGSWAFAVAYVPAVTLTALGVTAAVVLLYLGLGARSLLEKARPLLSWVQIISILVIFYGAQAMLRSADGGVEYFAARPPAWLEKLPTALLARAVEACVHGRWSDAALTFGVGAGGVAVLGLLAGLVLGARWGRVSTTSSSSDVRVTSSAGRSGATRVEAAIYWLVRTMLKRDSELKLKSIPVLATPAAAVALGWATGQLGDPSAVKGTAIVLALAAPVLLAGGVPSLFQNVLFSRSADAGLMLSVAPIARGSDVARGARRAVLRALLAPAVAVLGVALVVAWREPAHVALHVAAAWLMVEHAARLAQAMVLTSLPFSRAPVRGGAFGGAIGVSAIALAAGMGVAAAQYALAGSLLGQAAVVVALGVLLWPSGRWAEPPPTASSERGDEALALDAEGQLQLIALTFVVAAALAGGAASQRKFFEGYVREKLPVASAASADLATRIEHGETVQIDAETVTALYQLWLQEAEGSRPELPSKLAAAAPVQCVELVERTLVAGSEEQADRAAAFAAATRSPAFVPALELGVARAQRLGLQERVDRYGMRLRDLQISAQSK